MEQAGPAGVNRWRGRQAHDALRHEGRQPFCGGRPVRKHGRMTTETHAGRDVIAQFLPQSPFVAKLGISKISGRSAR
jgi:hypothetical protein